MLYIFVTCIELQNQNLFSQFLNTISNYLIVKLCGRVFLVEYSDECYIISIPYYSSSLVINLDSSISSKQLGYLEMLLKKVCAKAENDGVSQEKIKKLVNKSHEYILGNYKPDKFKATKH